MPGEVFPVQQQLKDVPTRDHHQEVTPIRLSPLPTDIGHIEPVLIPGKTARVYRTIALKVPLHGCRFVNESHRVSSEQDKFPSVLRPSTSECLLLQVAPQEVQSRLGRERLVA